MAIQEARLLTQPALLEETIQNLTQLLPSVLACGSLALQGGLHLALARCLLTGLQSADVAQHEDRHVLQAVSLGCMHSSAGTIPRPAQSHCCMS